MAITSLHSPAAARVAALPPTVGLGLSLLLAPLHSVLAAGTSAESAGPAGSAPPAVTASQRSAARQVAQSGVDLADLAPQAPPRYTVKPGDTLWSLAGLYLRSPWRWPALWGLNLASLPNPHRIYPGQQLELVREAGRARLQVVAGGPSDRSAPPTVTLSPRVRSEPARELALPAIQPRLLEPFLTQPLLASEEALRRAPRLISGVDQRTLLGPGDRVYARGPGGAPLQADSDSSPSDWMVVRPIRQLRDPLTGQPLALEVQMLGRARLVSGEAQGAAGAQPAALDILSARQELRAGDLLMPLAPRQLTDYSPQAPEAVPPGLAVAAIYGDTVSTAGQNQVVALNKGEADGLASGHVLAVLRSGALVHDPRGAGTGAAADRVQLPAERDGLVMVFRTFDHVAYALVLETRTGVRPGDRLAQPR